MNSSNWASAERVLQNPTTAEVPEPVSKAEAEVLNALLRDLRQNPDEHVDPILEYVGRLSEKARSRFISVAMNRFGDWQEEGVRALLALSHWNTIASHWIPQAEQYFTPDSNDFDRKWRELGCGADPSLSGEEREREQQARSFDDPGRMEEAFFEVSPLAQKREWQSPTWLPPEIQTEVRKKKLREKRKQILRRSSVLPESVLRHVLEEQPEFREDLVANPDLDDEVLSALVEEGREALEQLLEIDSPEKLKAWKSKGRRAIDVLIDSWPNREPLSQEFRDEVKKLLIDRSGEAPRLIWRPDQRGTEEASGLEAEKGGWLLMTGLRLPDWSAQDFYDLWKVLEQDTKGRKFLIQGLTIGELPAFKQFIRKILNEGVHVRWLTYLDQVLERFPNLMEDVQAYEYPPSYPMLMRTTFFEGYEGDRQAKRIELVGELAQHDINKAAHLLYMAVEEKTGASIGDSWDEMELFNQLPASLRQRFLTVDDAGVRAEAMRKIGREGLEKKGQHREGADGGSRPEEGSHIRKKG